MVTADNVTKDMVKWVVAVVASVGSVAGYIEFRSTENAKHVREELISQITWTKAELASDIKTKYDMQSGIKLEQVLENQKELLKIALQNQREIQETTKEVLKLTQKLEVDVNSLKSSK